MKNNNNKENMIERLVKSTAITKKIFFLFFAVILSFPLKSQNCQIIDFAIVTDVGCYGQATGAIDLVLLDTLGSYLISWDNFQFTEDISNLIASTYSVQIIDMNDTSCVQDTSFIVSQPQDPLSSTINLNQDVSCFGDSTGSALAAVIGGTPGYSYLWGNGQTTALATNLWAGYHTVTFIDQNGCSLVDSIEIINLHPEIVGTIQVLDNISCFNECDGIAVLSSTGGVLQHTYFWGNGQTYIGSGPDTAYNLCEGGYSFIIEDALGCRKTDTFRITQPDELFAQAIQVQPVQCYGFNDGMAFASATGGTTPYLFVWDDPVNGETGQSIDSLTPGIHTVYVTDLNGCTAQDTVVISEPTQLEVVIVDTMTVYSYCAGTNSGQLCALASGGTPNYSYSWNDALNQNASGVVPGVMVCATDIVAQFNDYTVVVMDERNCIATASFQLDSITNSMNPDSVIITIDHLSCFGIYDGAVSVSNVVGAVPPFTYNWTGPSGYTGTGTSITSLYDGNYDVTIEDANGCQIILNAEVVEPDQLEYTTYNVIGETCYGANDGQIWVNINGGTGNYYYDISETGTFPILNINQVQLINDSLILNLSQGQHNIYITDDNNCEGAVVWGGRFQEIVDSGLVVTLTGVVTADATCFNTNDGQAWIQWPGADPLFNYSWQTDPIGTVLDTGVETSILFPGNYNLVVHYADSASFGQNYVGCDLVQPFTIGGPIALTSGAVIVNENCFDADDGSISLSPNSAASPYTVVWDTTTSIPGNSTSLNQSPLQPGVYTVTITDGDGCEITEDYIVEEADPITASISFIAPLCNGDSNGSATVTPAGGSGSGWTYSWSPSGGSNATTSPISANTYTVDVTDGNGCLASFSVIVTEPEPLIANISASLFYNEDQNGNPYHISCFGASDGAAIITNGGGVAPITYSWMPSGGNNQEETGMSAGLNTVTVTDANNCSQTETITLIEPDFLDPNIFENIYSTSTNGITNEISCFGLADGWIESQTLGGVPSNVGFLYSWVNDNTGLEVSTSYIAENLSANTSYTVTVTDANGCISSATSTILDEPDPFIADVTTINYIGPMHAPFDVHFIDNTISIDPFNFVWTWEDGTDNFASGTDTMSHEFVRDNIGQNNVYVILTNSATGCTDSVAFVIDVQGIPDIHNVFTPNADGVNDEFSFGEYGMGSIDISIYNRWGQLVNSWNGMNKIWDGKGFDGNDVPEGVYFYVLVAEGEDGYYYDYKGSITLLR